MWQLKTDITGVLKVLGGARGDVIAQVKEVEGFPATPPRSKELYLLWTDPPHIAASLPSLFVTATTELREFLAWTSTYLDGYRPLTALCRVLDWETLERCRNAKIPPEFRKVESACAAMVLAEALTHGRNRVDPSNINIATCQSTYSFCKAQELVLGLDEGGNWLARKWRIARDTTKQPERIPVPEHIDVPWSLLSTLVRPMAGCISGEVSRDLRDAGEQLMSDGTVGEKRLQLLSQNRIDIREILEAMTQTREQRITALDTALRKLANLRVADSPELQFLAGYLASLLNPGSLEYIDFVTSQLDAHPTLLLWFALCVGLHPQSGILGQFSGLCRRILRDIRQSDSLLSLPRCDIAVDELEVLAKSRGGLEYLRIGAQSPARVEIYPQITVSLRLVAPPADQASLFNIPRGPELENWMRHLGEALANLEDIYDHFGSRLPPREQETFNLSKKKRQRKR